MKKVLAVAALIGTAGAATVADAGPVAATLVRVTSYSPNGASVWNSTADTSTWTFDTAAGTAAMTGGSYSRLSKVGATPLMRHNMTGVTLGNFAPTGATWACIEGTFGGGGGNTGGVGASICGNYNFGVNQTNQSTYTPTTTGSTVTIGGDDGIIGPSQSLVGSYSSMTTFAVAGAPIGSQRYCLSNTDATVLAERCASPPGTPPTSGYDFLFEILAPTAVDDGPIAATEGVATVIPVGVNDAGYTNPSTIIIETPPTKGTISTFSPPGPPAGLTITYTANSGAVGADSFVYRLTDTTAATDTATVSITVTSLQDTSPDQFTFVDQLDVAPYTVVTSLPVTVSGITAPSSVTVAGGAYSIGCGNTFTIAVGTISSGQTICVRHTSADAPATRTDTVLEIGGVSDTFTSTTAASSTNPSGDSTPDAFTFVDVVRVAPSSLVTSNAVAITGIDTAATISVDDGAYSIGCTNAFTMATGVISNGETVCVQQTSAEANSGVTNTRLTIGGVSDTFTTVVVGSSGGGGTLDGFSLFALGLVGWLRRKITSQPG